MISLLAIAKIKTLKPLLYIALKAILHYFRHISALTLLLETDEFNIAGIGK